METENALILPGGGDVLEPIVEVVENRQEPFHVEIPDGPVGRVIQIVNNSDRSLIVHLPGGIAIREMVQADNVLDEAFIRGAVRMSDVPRDLRSCFSCGRFVAKSRWQLDMSRRRLPICADCDSYRDWQP